MQQTTEVSLLCACTTPASEADFMQLPQETQNALNNFFSQEQQRSQKTRKPPLMCKITGIPLYV